MARTRTLHLAHWGAFEAETEGGAVVAAHPFARDPDPSPLIRNVVEAQRHKSRVARPAIRAGWLENGPGPDDRRGADRYVEADWPTALGLLARELRRVYDKHGPKAVYGGSYGWASAGRFHHAQCQVHRFLNCLGGYVGGEHTYSNGALTVVMPHVVGSVRDYLDRATSWSVLERETELFVCFGGLPLKNTMVTPGGASRHPTRDHILGAKRRGAEFVLVGPLRDDIPAEVGAEWVSVSPGTDVALMLGLAFVLSEEGILDRPFLAKYCVGFDRFEQYLRGRTDGRPKNPEWAERICGVPAAKIRALARRMAAARTFVAVNWSLQRARHGEQAPWMAVVLAAMLGQIGLPGGGFGHGYGSLGYVGRPQLVAGLPTFPQGANPVRDFIPFARIADMLLRPGEAYDFDGARPEYPDIRLVYWCGGNPFHHHQHLARLRRAFCRPETIVVHEPYWTPMAKHADIVLPVTTTLERDDIGGSTFDPALIWMGRVVPPFSESRDEYDIYSDLARSLGVGDAFTEGRDSEEWLARIYEDWRRRAREKGFDAPHFVAFRETGYLEMPTVEDETVLFEGFRADPVANPLGTPSGRIEIFSERVESFGYEDCRGHPAWLPPEEWAGAPTAARFPLVLVANNPTTRLHSQLDAGGLSRESKIRDREPMRMHPADAAARGLRPGDVARVFNDRGSCLAGVVATDAVRRGVVQLATGAWYDPVDPLAPAPMCAHGNPNVLTADWGTSKLARACAGQHSLVQVEKWEGELPPIRAFDPPPAPDRLGELAEARLDAARRSAIESVSRTASEEPS